MLTEIAKFVKPYSEIHTDEWCGYSHVGGVNGYWHKRVNHSVGQYHTASGVGVNGLEGFWAQLKRGIAETHIHVSPKHLPKYLGEFEFRHNRRDRPQSMLTDLMTGFWR